MGKGLVRNLLRAGYDVSVAADRSAKTRNELVTLGAALRSDTAALINDTDVILTCLPNMQSVEQVFLGEGGLVTAAESGTLVVDCTSSDPVVTRSIAARLAKKGVGFVDAPLLGSLGS